MNNNNINYHKEMIKVIENIYNITSGEEIKMEKKKEILLHSCCGPCSTSVIDTLKKYFKITVYFHNPNIYPREEYVRRKSEQIKYINALNVEECKFLDLDDQYESDNKYEDFKSIYSGLEKEREGGKRCYRCLGLRIWKTGQKADELDIPFFTSTLSVSPHKNSKIINTLGLKLSNKLKSQYLVNDFKKNDGYKKSIILAKEFDLYRQDYCGCKHSKENINEI